MLYTPAKLHTKITALVEPPDRDAGRMASEGGCRLMAVISVNCESLGDLGRSQEVER